MTSTSVQSGHARTSTTTIPSALRQSSRKKSCRIIYIKAANKLFSQADDVQKKVESVVFKVLDIAALEKQRLELAARQEATISKIENSMSGVIQDSEEVRASNDLMEILKDIQNEMSDVVSEINDKKARKASIKAFLDELSKEEPVTKETVKTFV